MSPLLNDYIRAESFGVNQAISTAVNFVAYTITTSGTILMQEFWSINLIFDFYGVFVILSAMLSYCLLADIKTNTNKKEAIAVIVK